MLDREIVAQAAVLAREQAAMTALVAERDSLVAETPAWVAYRCRVPKHVAKAMVTCGRALPAMPEVAAAFSAGDIGSDHVRVLAAALRRCSKAFEKVEAELVEDARTLRYDVFRRRVQYFVQLADEDGVEGDAREVFEARSVCASRTFEDTVRLDGTMEPIGGAIFLEELRRLEQLEFEADWREARGRVGADARSSDLRRTPARRRHDALVEMAKRSAAMPPGAKRARYLLTVHVGYETLHGRICELADGTVLAPGQVVPLLGEADVERAVFGPDSRVVDLGRRSRLFVGGARRAVQVSELECGEPSCDVRYDRCEVDHVQRWERGGATDRANGRLRCPRHHEGRRRAPPIDDG